MLLDRPFAENQRRRDRRVALALGHLPEDLTLPRGEPLDRASWDSCDRAATSCSTTLAVDDRSAGRHGAHGVDEIVGVGNTILEQIGAAVGTGFEERQGVATEQRTG